VLRCRNFGRQCTGLIEDPQPALFSNGLQDTRVRMIRRAIAFVHVLRDRLRSQPTDAGIAAQLLPAEYQAMERAGNKPDFLMLEMGADLQRCLREQRIAPCLAANIDNTLSALTAAAASCERIKNTPIPYSYTLLLHRTAYIYCFLLPFGLVDSIGYLTPLVVAIVAPAGEPIFRWQEPQHHLRFEEERNRSLEQWRTQATSNVARLLPGCGIELLLPEAYYVACREADKLIRPISIRAAVHYLTNTLGVEASDLRAVVAGFGEEAADIQIDEYRVSFTMRQSPDVVYGIVWPLYGQEDEEGTPMEGPLAAGGALLSPINEIIAHLNDAGIAHIKRINERYAAEYCDDCGSPLFADPTGELVHAEMPEDAPAGSEHFH